MNPGFKRSLTAGAGGIALYLRRITRKRNEQSFSTWMSSSQSETLRTEFDPLCLGGSVWNQAAGTSVRANTATGLRKQARFSEGNHYIATMLVGSGLEDRFQDPFVITVILQTGNPTLLREGTFKGDAGPGTAPAYGIRILVWMKPIHQNFLYIWREMRSILQARTG